MPPGSASRPARMARSVSPPSRLAARSSPPPDEDELLVRFASMSLAQSPPAVAAVAKAAGAKAAGAEAAGEPKLKRPDAALRSGSTSRWTWLVVCALVLSQQPHARQLIEHAAEFFADSWRDFDFCVPLPPLLPL